MDIECIRTGRKAFTAAYPDIHEVAAFMLSAWSTLGVPVKLEDVAGHPLRLLRHSVYSESNKSTEPSQGVEIADLPV